MRNDDYLPKRELFHSHHFVLEVKRIDWELTIRLVVLCCVLVGVACFAAGYACGH